MTEHSMTVPSAPLLLVVLLICMCDGKMPECHVRFTRGARRSGPLILEIVCRAELNS